MFKEILFIEGGLKMFRAMVIWSFTLIFVLSSLFSLTFSSNKLGHAKNIGSPNDKTLERLKYNNPGLTVDLAAGLWGHPVPMDFDGDGDLDLLVSSSDKPYNGLYFFENVSGNVKHPVFKPGVRVSGGLNNVAVSYSGNRPIVTTPGKVYPDFTQTGLYPSESIPFNKEFPGISDDTRGNEWRYVDYDGDGVLDLIVGIGDWGDYGWDAAFNSEGEWTNGPLHGYVFLIENLGTNDKPDYAKPEKIKAEGKPIDVFGNPSPVVADFNGNGKLDIITGEFLDKLTFFENDGTRTKPEYKSGRYLKNDEKTINMDLQMIELSAIDWTKDGNMDLIVAQEDGRVALIENTGDVVDGKPVFKKPYYFQQEADDVKIGALATPVSYDWDGDGNDDLIVGDSSGRISFIKNLDGGDPPKWDAPKPLKVDGEEIRIQAGKNGSVQGPAEAKWGYTVPMVADWNHDGLPDILINSIWGKVMWYENVGTRTNPKLAESRPIEVEWEGETPKPEWNWWDPEGDDLVTQWRTTPYVTDFNGDGLNDLIMLDQEGYLSFFERKKINGELKLLPGKRIFKGEKGSLQLSTKSAGDSGRRKFTMADWTGDGKLDLLVDSSNVKLLKNVGTKKEPFQFENMGDISEGELAGHTTSPTIVDWDNNDVPDLLIGAEDGHLYYQKNNYKKETPPRESSPKGDLRSLIGQWKFDNKGGDIVQDSSGYNNYGVINGATRESGHEGQALVFDGFNDYVNLDYTVGPYLDGAKGITVSGWVKMKSLDTKLMRIFGTRINGGTAGAELTIRGNDETIDMAGRSQSSDGYTRKKVPLEKLSMGEWHFVAGVMDYVNNEIKIYVDGVEQTPIDDSPIHFDGNTYDRGSASQPDSIGRSPNGGSYFNGMLDDIRVYREALTDDEITDLFQASHSAESLKTRVEDLYKKNKDNFNSEEVIHALKLHLSAVSHFEKKEKADKVVKHMNGFERLLEHQKKNNLISEKAYQTLKDSANLIIKKWE